MWLIQWCGGSSELFHQRRGEGTDSLCVGDSSVSLHARDAIRMSGREGLSSKDRFDNEKNRGRG